MKALVIDITRCNGCYNSQIACKDKHIGNALWYGSKYAFRSDWQVLLRALKISHNL